MKQVDEKRKIDAEILGIAKEVIERNRDELLENRQVKQIIDWYEPAFEKGKSFFQRFLAFLKAENQLGKTFGVILDVWGFFDPRITTARDYVRERIIKHL